MSRGQGPGGQAPADEATRLIERCRAYATGRRALTRLFALLPGAADGPRVTLGVADVPTAQIRFVPSDGQRAERGGAGEFQILLGRRFIAEQASADADLAFLVAHELLHLVRGDLWASEDAAEAVASNIASDAINDAFLLGPAMGRAFTGVDGLWGRRDLRDPVEALLTPLDVAAARLGYPAARGWGDAVVRERLFEHARPPAAPRYRPGEWAEVHATLEERGRTGTIELAEALPRVKGLLEQLPKPRSARAGVGASGEAREAQAALHQSWQGAGGPVDTVRVTPCPQDRLTRWLRRFVAETAANTVEDAESAALRGPGDGGTVMGRRAVVEYAAGLRALPFARLERTSSPALAGVTLYLDASASMSDALPPIVGDLGERGRSWLAEPIWAFSTEVFPVTVRELRQGSVPSTGGTSFDVVAKHILATRTRRAALITDGEGELEPRLLAALRDAGVAIALVSPGRPGPTPFDPVVSRRHRWALNLPT